MGEWAEQYLLAIYIMRLTFVSRRNIRTGTITEAQLENVFGAQYNCALNSRGLRTLEIAVVNNLHAEAKTLFQDRSRRYASTPNGPHIDSPPQNMSEMQQHTIET